MGEIEKTYEGIMRQLENGRLYSRVLYKRERPEYSGVMYRFGKNLGSPESEEKKGERERSQKRWMGSGAGEKSER